MLWLLVQAQKLAAQNQATPPSESMDIASFEEFMQDGSSTKAHKKKSRSEGKKCVTQPKTHFTLFLDAPYSRVQMSWTV